MSALTRESEAFMSAQHIYGEIMGDGGRVSFPSSEEEGRRYFLDRVERLTSAPARLKARYDELMCVAQGSTE